MANLFLPQYNYHKRSNYYISSNFLHSNTGKTSIDYSFNTSDDVIVSSNFSINDRAILLENNNESLTPQGLLHLIRKNCKRESLTHQLGFIEVIEQLYDISDSLSKSHVLMKMVIAETDRIHEHCQWLYELLTNSGLRHLSNELKAFKTLISQFLYVSTSIKRNKVSNCIEVGVLNHSWNEETSILCNKALDRLNFNFVRIKENLMANQILRDLLLGIGIMSTGLAEKSGSVGPISRASGLANDLRVQDPYWDYFSIKRFKLAISYDQDLYGKFKVVLNEIQTSLEILNYCINSIEIFDPEYYLDDVKMDQYGHLSTRIESSNGPALYRVVCDENMNIKGFGMSSPSLTNLNSLETRLIGQPINHSLRIIHAYNLVQFSIVSK
ncbi:MAG: hypothetical protein ACC656_07575 [Candidatus Heimdallarchaeota archaeon]